MDNFWRSRPSRRVLLRRSFALGAGLAGAALVGCSDDDEGGATEPATTASSATTSTSEGPGPARGGTLRVAQAEEPRDTDPHGGLGTSDSYPHRDLVYDSLVRKNPETLIPDPSWSLAEEWEQADELTVVLKIRPGVTIASTGEPVDAELAVWNLERGKAGLSAAPLASMSSAEAVSDYEVVVRLSDADSSFIENLTSAGYITSRQQFESVGPDRMLREPVGSGPFELVEWRTDASLQYKANPNYWRRDSQGVQMPYLNGIEVRVIPDPAVSTAALEADEIDLTVTPPIDIKRLNSNPQLQAVKLVGANREVAYINHDFPPMDNEWVRRAFGHALDSMTFAQNFLTGEEAPAGSILFPHDPAYVELEPRVFDPGLVRTYLERSGLPEDEWVVRGQPRAEVLDERELFWDDNFRRAGLPIAWNDGMRNAFGQLFMRSQGAPGTAGFLMSRYQARGTTQLDVSHLFSGDGNFNPTARPVEELAPLVEKARATFDEEERKAIYRDIQVKHHEMLYSVIPFVYAVAYAHAQKRVGNLNLLFQGRAQPNWEQLSLG